MTDPEPSPWKEPRKKVEEFLSARLPPVPEIHRYLLDRIEGEMRQRWDRELLGLLHVDLLESDVRNLALRFRTELLGRLGAWKVDVPATWWEHLKLTLMQRWLRMPRWLKRRLSPIRMLRHSAHAVLRDLDLKALGLPPGRQVTLLQAETQAVRIDCWKEDSK